MNSSRERIYQVLLVACGISIVVLAAMTYASFQSLSEHVVDDPAKYPLLSPGIASSSIEDFERHQSQVRVSYSITQRQWRT